MDEMDETVGDILRRVNEWRKKRHHRMQIILDQEDAKSKGIVTALADDLQVENYKREEHEPGKSLWARLAFVGLEAEYTDTMVCLARFLDENVTEEKLANLPKIAWWQKLKKLFEIEESFSKQSREAYAANNWEDYEIYTGLAKNALQQIRDSTEKVGKTTNPVAEKSNLPSLPNAQTVTEHKTRPDTQQRDSYSFKFGRKLRRLLGRLFGSP